MPNRGGSLAVDNIDRLFEEMALGLETLGGGDLANIAVIHLASAFHLEKGAVAAFALPPFQFYLSDVLDKESLDDRNPFVFHPFVVAGLGAIGEGTRFLLC